MLKNCCGVRAIIHFRTCCYRKLMYFRVITVTLYHVRLHHMELSLIIFQRLHTMSCFIFYLGRHKELIQDYRC